MTADHDLLFGNWLKRLRAQHDLTQERLAEQVGCAVQTIRMIERGARRPSREMAQRLVDVLHVPEAEREHVLRLARARLVEAPAPIPLLRHDHEVAAPARRRVRLPVPATALIGREAEQAALRQRLADPSCRLVTLLGAGGTGKTRLALQLATHLSQHMEEDIAFVELAQIVSVEHVAAAIADALRCPIIATQPLEESLLAWLRPRQMLLMLDNLEHLLNATALIATILQEAPGVRMLVTSRERLRLREEWVFELGGLAIPSDNTRAQIERCDAVRLFVERARKVSTTFVLNAHNRAAVAQICRQLDGMPLGLELAATWVRVLSPDEIAAELARDLDFLSLSDRNSDPRHQSMRAVIDYSWALLTPAEQRVLARCSVFRGGWSRAAAEQVAGASLPLLASLADKSLIRRTAAGRYEMHELVRQYAADQLAANPSEAQAAHEQHCAYYANWLASRKPMLQGLQQHEAVAEITTEIDNVRAAWQYAVDHRSIDALWLMTQGSVLTWFYELRSWYQECEALTRRAVEVLRAVPPTTRRDELLLATLVGNQGWHAFRCGRPEEGMRLLQESLDMLRPGDHSDFLFITLEQLAYLTLFTGDFEQAVALVEAQQPVVQQITDPWLLAHARFQRAAVYVDRSPDLAYERLHEGLPYMRAVGDRYVIILSLCHLGDIAIALGKLDEAERSFVEVLNLSRAISNGVGESNALGGLAMIACARHAWDDAIMYSLEAMARSREVGDTWTQARALISLGEAEIGAGDPVSGRRNLKQAITLSLASRVLPVAIDAWLRLAALDIQARQFDETLLRLVALVQRHSVTSYYAAERASGLWASLAAHVNAGMLASAEHAASTIAPDQLESLLRAYVERRPVALSHVEPPAHVLPPASGLHVPETGEILSPREVEVLRLLIAGASNQIIANTLVISIYTAKHHVASILQKLGAATRTQAALHGRALGLEPLTTR